jgi:membrane protein YdbS with pleckstrin-like domain
VRGTADEPVRLEARQHGAVLLRPFAAALLLAVAAGFLAAAGWPAAFGATLLLLVAAAVALRAAWRWERTRLVVTTERLLVLSGTFRRRSAAVRLSRVGAVEVEQSLAGALLGYGTLVTGELEIPYVPRPREVTRLLV